MRGQDLLTALADELRSLASELAQTYDVGNDPAGAAHAADSYVASVNRLSEAAGYMGLTGVQRACACVVTNLQSLHPDDVDARLLVRPFFTEWAPLLEAHLREAAAAEPIEALLRHFAGSWVPVPLESHDLEVLRAELSAASSIGAALDASDDAPPEVLGSADLTLDISNDVDA